MEIFFVTSEIAPYSRSTTVGDVCAALPKALRSIGHKVTVISPLWSEIDPNAHGLARRLSGVEVALGASRQTCTLYDARTTGGVELVFVGAPAQNAALALCQVALHIAVERDAAPDVIHAHGSFAAPVLSLAAEGLARAARVLSLHDVSEQAELLRAGIVAAERVVVSSQTHRTQLVQAGNGHGPAQLLAEAGKLTAIPNGLDAARWNPLTDPLLPARFDPAERAGKARCKDALQFELGLLVRPDVPLFCAVGRAAPLAALVEPLLRNTAQLVVLAHDPKELAELRGLVQRYGDQLKLIEQADERALHRAVAAADFMLLPEEDTRYGDLHLCAQRYGALPVARRLGAYADAIIDCDANLLTGSGFVYDTGDELLTAAQRALAAFAKGDGFSAIQKRVMKLDVSWDKSARRYEHLYRALRPAT